MTARLPTPGGDSGTWGTILNDYLNQSLNPDGSLKPIPESGITNLTSDLNTLTTSLAGKLTTSSNLSELSSTATTARSNLGLGSAATHPASDFDSAGAAAAVAATQSPLQTVVAVVSTSGTLVPNAQNPVNATTGPLSMSLPPGQAQGTLLGVSKTDASTNAITITGNIRGIASSSLTLSLAKEGLLLQADSAGSWWPMADHKTLGSLDSRYQPTADVVWAPEPNGTDDTSALQALLAAMDNQAAGSTGTGGVLMLRSATYKINPATPLRVGSNTRVQGVQGKTVFQATAQTDSPMLKCGYGVGFNECYDIHVDGISFIWPTQPSSRGVSDGVIFARVHRASITNCYVLNCPGVSIAFNRVQDGLMQGNHVAYSGIDSLNLDNGSDTASGMTNTDIRIVNNFVEYSGDDAISVVSRYSTNYGGSTGWVNADPNRKIATRIVIANNVINYVGTYNGPAGTPTGGGIGIYGVDGCVIANNTIQDVNSHAIMPVVEASCYCNRHLTITGNVINCTRTPNSSEEPPGVLLAAITLGDRNNTSQTGYEEQTYGLYDCIVANNEIFVTDRYGIYSAAGNTSAGNTQTGVADNRAGNESLWTSGVSIKNNLIKWTGSTTAGLDYRGISLTNVLDFNVSDNEVRGFPSIGFLLRSHRRSRVTGNKFIDCVQDSTFQADNIVAIGDTNYVNDDLREFSRNIIRFSLTAARALFVTNTGTTTDWTYLDNIYEISSATFTVTQATLTNKPATGVSVASAYAPIGLPGASIAARFVGGITNAAPSSGSFNTGDAVLDTTGKWRICTAGGSPGTWVVASAGPAGWATVATWNSGTATYSSTAPASVVVRGNYTYVANATSIPANTDPAVDAGTTVGAVGTHWTCIAGIGATGAAGPQGPTGSPGSGTTFPYGATSGAPALTSGNDMVPYYDQTQKILFQVQNISGTETLVPIAYTNPPVPDPIQLAAIADPAAPSAGNPLLYPKTTVGRDMWRTENATNKPMTLQPGWFSNHVTYIGPQSGTALSTIGIGATSVGTISHLFTSQATGYYANFVSGAVAGNTAGTGANLGIWNRGNAVGSNGWFFRTRLYLPDASYGSSSTGSRVFCGMTLGTLAAVVAADDTGTYSFGFQYSTNRGDTDWQFSAESTSGTQALTDTAMVFNAQHIYDFGIFMAPQGSTMYWRIEDLTAATSQQGSITTPLPTYNAYLRHGFQLATLTTTARNIGLLSCYCESDV